MPARSLSAQPEPSRPALLRLRRFGLSSSGLAGPQVGGPVPGAATEAGEGYVDVDVNASNSCPLAKQDRRALIPLYIDRSCKSPAAGATEVFDQARDSAQRQALALTFTGMGRAQIDSYWAWLHFAGRVVQPKRLSNQQALLAEVQLNTPVIAFLRRPLAEGGAKPLMPLSRIK